MAKFGSMAWLGAAVLSLSCASARGISRHPDQVVGANSAWLEEIEGERALDWVREQNRRSQTQLEAEPLFAKAHEELLKIVMAKDRIPWGWQHGQRIFNFWQDEKSVRGVLRSTTLRQYVAARPRWRTELDLDALAAQEKENWVYDGIQCLPNGGSRCLVQLSRGGKDAIVVREFDLNKRLFVTGGFDLPEAKSNVAWWSEDVVLVGSNWGPGTVTRSGYPRQVRVWRRGVQAAASPLLFEAQESDLSASPMIFWGPNGKQLFISRAIDFFSQELFWVRPDFGELRKVPLPADAELLTIFDGQAVARVRTPWRIPPELGQGELAAGEIFSFDFSQWLATGKIGPAASLFRATEAQAFQGLAQVRSGLILTYLENVQSRMQIVNWAQHRWRSRDISLEKGATASIVDASPFYDGYFLRSETFLQPTRMFYAAKPERVPMAVMAIPPRFNSSNMTAEQHWATSADGTRIPYFEVGPKAEGPLPTLLTAYGGFEIAMTPYYLGGTGKVWLERGGRYVLANIRGGGEFGPRWHEAGRKENRLKVFQDFIAVAEDLIRRGVATPQSLGISGGSNGGLLVSAVTMMRPELFKAVVCQVPLTDMLNYHRWLAGASWIGEYGNPDEPEMRKVLAAYSPFHNVREGVEYPEILFVTSTKDDRVHPAHARKLAYRLGEVGRSFLYYENIEGGHGAAANLKQRAYRSALEFSYLSQRLGLKTGPN